MRRIEDVSEYYSERIDRFGPTSPGVDWNSKDGQLARFERFNRLFERLPGALSVIDYGCGYGELYKFLLSRSEVTSYAGVNVAPARAEATRKLLGDDGDTVILAKCFVSYETYNVDISVNLADWAGDSVFDNLKAVLRKATFGTSVDFQLSLYEPKNSQSTLFYSDSKKAMGFFLWGFTPLANLEHSYSLWEFAATVHREL